MSHDAHGDQPSFLQHHFDTPQQQFSAGKLGMWLFLAQEILFFGGLFCFYATFRFNHPEVFDYAHKFLDPFWGAVNTVVLLVSSLTMALAVRAAQLSKNRQLLLMLALTFICASAFMVVKYFEYSHKHHLGLFFGKSMFSYEKLYDAEVEQGRVSPNIAVAETVANIKDVAQATENEPARSIIYQAPVASSGLSFPTAEPEVHAEDHSGGHSAYANLPPGVRPRNVHVFFQIYFCLTGLHGIHVLAGMIMLIWLFWGATKGKYNSAWFTPVDLGGLYWHLVDLVWIYLFPLLYLIS